MDKIVSVDEQEVFTLGLINTKIARGGHAAVFLMENPNAIIGRSQLFAKLGGAIGRTVVNEDNLEVRHCLRLNRLHATGHMPPSVVHRNNHTHCWHIFHSYLRPRNAVMIVW